MKKLLLFVLALSASRIAIADIVNVDQLNQRLQQRSSGWIAKQTWVNQLSKTEAKRLMGLPGHVGAETEFMIPQSRIAGLPLVTDWRNKDNQNWVSPILNQANCGSCVAFAAIGVLETQFNISSLVPNLNFRFSPQNLFSCGGGACDYGWFPSAAASFLMKKGVVDEACHSYTSGATGKDVSCKTACADASLRTFKIAGYDTPSRGALDLATVKQALQKGPLMTTLTVYADFMVYASGVYKHTTGEALGGHAVSIVGYDDNEQAFIIRNSWGQEWGENGFAKVAYSDISGIGESTWGFQTPKMVGTVALLYPRDYDYVTGPIAIDASSTHALTKTLTATVYDRSRQAIWSASCENQACQMNLDTTTMPEGRYEVQVIALDEVGKKIDSSMRQFFYVVNKEPAFELSMMPQGTTFEKPFKGRVVFDVKTKSNSVPMGLLKFHYKDSSGVEKIKSADVVLDGMTLGWRTNIIPNGTYEIWMTGELKSNSMQVVKETPKYTIQVKN